MPAKLRQWIEDALLVLVSCLLFTALVARAEELAQPVMLVASNELQGPYAGTVLVAVPSGRVHVGFILNRATDVRLATLFPSHAPSLKVVDPVFFGGPEMTNSLFAVLARDPGKGAAPLFGGFFVATAVETIDRIIEQTPNDARYFAGFVGWEPGELEQEIARGWWYVTEPDASLLERDPSGAWEALVRKLGKTPLQRGMKSAALRLR